MSIRPELILIGDEEPKSQLLLQAALWNHANIEESDFTIFATDETSEENLIASSKLWPKNFIFKEEIDELQIVIEDIVADHGNVAIHLYIDAPTNFVLESDEHGIRISPDSGGAFDDDALLYMERNALIQGVTVYNWGGQTGFEVLEND